MDLIRQQVVYKRADQVRRNPGALASGVHRIDRISLHDGDLHHACGPHDVATDQPHRAFLVGGLPLRW
jgi:hypothetical protein